MSASDSKGEGTHQPPPAGPVSVQGPLKPDAVRPEPVREVAPRTLAEIAWARWTGRGINIAVLSVVALCCAYLLTPGLFTQRIPYGEESIGEFSDTVIKANRDYDIPDEETTRRKREEAREAVLPVYDYDVTIAESAVERVRSAFEMMRGVADEVARKLVPADPAETRGEERKRSRRREDEADQAAAAAALAEAKSRAFAERRAEWQRRLETQVDDETFKAFAADRFSEEAQRELERLVMRANGQMVAEYRDPLATAGSRGITVRRRAGADALSERVISDVSHIRDQNELREDSEGWHAGLPAEFPAALRKALGTLGSRQVRANLRFNREETEERRRLASESVKPVVIQLKKGEKIIGDGERIERRHLVIFSAIRSQSGSSDSFWARLGSALCAVVLVVTVYGFARVSLRRFKLTRKDAALAALTLVGMLALLNLSITIADALRDKFTSLPAEALYYVAPFAAGAMLLRFVLTGEAALVFAIVFSALSGVLVGGSLEFGIYALIGSLVASSSVAGAKDRAALFRAGLHTGLANACVVLCFALMNNKLDGWTTMAGCLSGFVGGALAVPILVMGLTPLVESLFGYTTDIKLLELANLNRPALKELIVQAPGTYHHSIIIGSLVEAAAEAIGANPLLARVCAYYHDIGKGRNPLYFAENQRGDNRHEKLAPQMSALIIKRHVSDGVEMARHYKLPKSVADAIPQHHGTRLVGFFYHKALKEQEGRPDPQPVDEMLYRYPGPKPQTREAALVMIADAVEASSRAMVEPTPVKLQGLVQKIINGIFADGQLDECDLTLRDLNGIARSFYRTLGGIYHTRPDYPAQALLPLRTQLAEVGAKAEAASKAEAARSEEETRLPAAGERRGRFDR